MLLRPFPGWEGVLCYSPGELGATYIFLFVLVTQRADFGHKGTVLWSVPGPQAPLKFFVIVLVFFLKHLYVCVPDFKRVIFG